MMMITVPNNGFGMAHTPTFHPPDINDMPTPIAVAPLIVVSKN